MINSFHVGDSRNIDKIIQDDLVFNVTITSPPYHDLKDYDREGQIGYSQGYHEYLDDLESVFSAIFDKTADDGSLWVIIDTFRKDGEFCPLPFDFAKTIEPIGWKLQEIIIWGKDKTVPWTHHGQMRNIFEYILVFSKQNDFKFYIDRVRDFENLKQWWVKYPERYNPRGKTPTAIWEFSIPTQGAWIENGIEHCCPLPEAMIERILALTTDEEDIVLDPFAGSGAVLAKATNMRRRYIGIELNSDYVNRFNQLLENTNKEKQREYDFEKRNIFRQGAFETLILDLRALKYAKMIHQRVAKKQNQRLLKIFVSSPRIRKSDDIKIIDVDYLFLLNDSFDETELFSALNILICKKPLSKFGISPHFTFTNDKPKFISELSKKSNCYAYTRTNTNFTIGEFEPAMIQDGDIVIFSPIHVIVNENDIE